MADRGTYQPAQFLIHIEGTDHYEPHTGGDTVQQFTNAIAEAHPGKYVNVYQHAGAIRAKPPHPLAITQIADPA